MDPIETMFRRSEKILDGLLEHAGEQLKSVGLHIEDHSARTYHYKNQHLFWSYSFLKEWFVDIDKARVAVSLDYPEPVQPHDPAEIRLTWRAELFREGQMSSIDRSEKAFLALDDLQRDGIAVVIANAVSKAAAHLPSSR